MLTGLQGFEGAEAQELVGKTTQLLVGWRQQ